MPQQRNSNNLADTIDSIAGGSSVDSLTEDYLNFYDCDGRLVYVYTEAETQALTELPPLPSGRSYHGWNRTLAEIQTYHTPVSVSAIAAVGNDSLFTFEFFEGDDLTVELHLDHVAQDGNYTVDWGDGTSNTYVGGDYNTTWSHTYASAGKYTVTVPTTNNSSHRYAGTFLTSNADKLIEAVIGSSITILDGHMFGGCINLRLVLLSPNTAGNVGTYFFEKYEKPESYIPPGRDRCIERQQLY